MYDALDNLTQVTDRNGRVRQYGFDYLNRRHTERWFADINAANAGNAQRTLSYTFNAADELTAASDPDSAYAFTPDALGRATVISNADTPGAPVVVLNQTFNKADERTNLSATRNGTADFRNSYLFDVRHDNREGIADAVSRTLGRRCLSRPTYLKSKDNREHSLLVKRLVTTKGPDHAPQGLRSRVKATLLELQFHRTSGSPVGRAFDDDANRSGRLIRARSDPQRSG